MEVPLLDLKKQYLQIKKEIDDVIAEICASQVFVLGPHVQSFEKNAAAYCASKHACAVSSGSDALLMALMAEDIGQGDEVITTPYTFFGTAGAIHRVGAKPVFVDIDPISFTINPQLIEQAITPKTKAIIPVHLFGQTANIGPIKSLCQKYNLILIEDAAQAIGAEYYNQRATSIGDYGCLSFYPSKNLGAYGDAGMITTQDDAKAEKLSFLRNHGMNPRYYHKYVGGNFRMDAIQAAVLDIKLKFLDEWTSKRIANANLYDSLLAGIPEVITPTVAPWSTRHTRNQYVIRILNGKRQKVWDGLKAAHVGVDVYYPVPLHLQECFQYLGYHKGDFPESEQAALDSLALPIFPELTTEQIAYVAHSIKSLLA